MTPTPRPLRVLHVVAALGPTNSQYHEHCLPLPGERRFVLCSLLPAAITPPQRVTVFSGDGSRLGAWRTLLAAIRHGQHDVIHTQVPVSAALLAAATLTARTERRRSVYSMTNSYLSYGRRNRLLLYPIFALFPQVVLCSEAVRASLPAPLAWLGRHRTTVVANGVDTDRVRQVVASTTAERTPHRGFTIVSVSRLVQIKDPLTLLAAFARVREPDDRLVFVGDGPLRPVLAEAVRAAGLTGQVEMTGMVPRDEAYRHLATADVYVSVSHGEGLPVAVLEAMAAGRPVILSDIPPHRELAETVTGGLPLVAPGDVGELARQLVHMKGLPRDSLLAMGSACRHAAEERYGVATMHRSLAAVYDRARQRPAGEGED